jgi:hypothetical protein
MGSVSQGYFLLSYADFVTAGYDPYLDSVKKQSDPHSGTVPETTILCGYYFLAPELVGKKSETEIETSFLYVHRNSPEIYAIRQFPALRHSPG